MNGEDSLMLSEQDAWDSCVTTGFFNTPPTAPATQFTTHNAEFAQMHPFMGGTQVSGQNSRQLNAGSPSNSSLRNQGARAASPVPAVNPLTRTTSRRSKYRNLDWDGAKARIKELYLDEDRTLQETMRIMKEAHSFDAS